MEMFGKIAGKDSQWGIVAIDKSTPDIMFTHTQGSPLLIGFNSQEDQVYVVSEKIAFQSFADCYLPTADGEIF
jgi:glucosamine 6-phosphate synthetase-like amidotransferase/phosphosugar isomerase protein